MVSIDTKEHNEEKPVQRRERINFVASAPQIVTVDAPVQLQASLVHGTSFEMRLRQKPKSLRECEVSENASIRMTSADLKKSNEELFVPQVKSIDVPVNLLGTQVQVTSFEKHLRHNLESVCKEENNSNEDHPISMASRGTNTFTTKVPVQRHERGNLGASIPQIISIDVPVNLQGARVRGATFEDCLKPIRKENEIKDQLLAMASQDTNVSNDQVSVQREKKGNRSASVVPIEVKGESFEQRQRRKLKSESKINKSDPSIPLQKEKSTDTGTGDTLGSVYSRKLQDQCQWSLQSQTASITEPCSTLASSRKGCKFLKESDGIIRRQVQEFRCSDVEGCFGFYTGTVAALCMEEEYLPHGRGEMIYDDGNIEEGFWSKGVLKEKVPGTCIRYRPFLLPGYSVGDACRKEDMVKATAEAVSKLHINDCAWIRRSDKSGKKGGWSFAIVLSRSDGDDASITFQVNDLGFTKIIGFLQWTTMVRLPRRSPPGYSVGDTGRIEDMVIVTEKEAVASVSKLNIGDAAFVSRSNGLWVYAILINQTDDSDARITFKINQTGSTKSIQMSKCGSYIRCIKHKHCGQSVETQERTSSARNTTQSQ